MENNYSHDDQRSTKLDAEPENKQKKEKKPMSESKKKLLKIVRFIVQNFGMMLLTIIYCCAGAYLFGILEGQYLLELCQSAKGDSLKMIQQYRTLIYNYLSFNVTFDPALVIITNGTEMKDGPEIYNQYVLDTLYQMRDEVLSNGYSGQNCETTNKWLFSSALLWTFTVLSTIG
jgi:hypothetical protein